MLQICPPHHLSDVAILPWEVQKTSFSTVLFMHTSDYLRYLRRKQTVIHLPTPPENVTTLTCELQNFFIRLKVCCVLSNAGGSEESQRVVGCHRWLWKEPSQQVTAKQQRHSKCSEWPPSALIHASSLFRHWSVAQYTTLCWNSAHVTTSRCRKPQHVHINTRAPPVACPRRSTRAMQIIGSTKQQ